MSGLDEIRKLLRNTDEEIVRLLGERAGLAKKIGEIKAGQGLSVYDPSQEARVYRHVQGSNNGHLSTRGLKAIFREIISASRAIQAPLAVAYLGPEASFTHLAAKGHFGQSVSFKGEATILNVFETVQRGKASFGVVPIENSLEGSVNLTLDCLVSSDLQIRAEIFQGIDHCLLSSGEDLGELRNIYSHPQALAQCQGWLRRNVPHCELIEVASTAYAARLVAGERTKAAIAGRLAAEIYSLRILKDSIEDLAGNTTRFLVVGQGEGEPTGEDKTSVIFSTKHVPGALCRALQPLADRGINLTKIESFPMKIRRWEYHFFVDFTGHRQNPEIAKCLEELRDQSAFLKILGSYPRGEV